jgi:DNA polymerase III subunit epsilon
MDTIRARNLGLFYDTETTGLPLFNEPSEDPRQPHIVQIGAVLVDMDTREELEVLDAIVRPDGWTIPDDVAAIHGITTERALAEGLPAKEVLTSFLAMWDSALGQVVRVAFNESFDARLVRIGLFRHFDEAIADHWKSGIAHDVMKVVAPICKLPPTQAMVRAGRGKQFKSPKLTEAHQHFFGEPLEGAHSALVDVRATLRIHWHVVDQQQLVDA